MASKPSKVSAKPDAWQANGFVNLTLSEAQIKDVFKIYDKAEKVESDMLKELSDGYKITFSFNPKTGAIVCSLSNKDTDSPNYGWILTSHAPTWFEALSISLYKHIIVLERNWGDVGAKASASLYG